MWLVVNKKYQQNKTSKQKTKQTEPRTSKEVQIRSKFQIPEAIWFVFGLI